MSIKLTDTQLVMLSAAAQREDRCIIAPPSLKGAAAQKIATKLVAAGLAKEIKAKPGGHVWRCDDATGRAYALKLTAAGLKAIAVEDAEAIEGAAGSRRRLPAKSRRIPQIMKSRRGSSRRQRQLPGRAKVQNSRRSWACSDARAALRSTSWLTPWAGFPIPLAPH